MHLERTTTRRREVKIDNRQSTIDNPQMRHDLMEILVCPLCKGDLTLNVTREEGEEIVEGTLACGQCNETYPIEDSIPNLLPPDLRD